MAPAREKERQRERERQSRVEKTLAAGGGPFQVGGIGEKATVAEPSKLHPSEPVNPVATKAPANKSQSESAKTLPSTSHQNPLDVLRKRVPEMLHERSRWIQAKISELSASTKPLADNFNRVTGYTAIEKLKQTVAAAEADLERARRNVRTCKQNYEAAIEQRSALQKEINELLTRKQAWTPQDVERFTQLYKSDHHNQQAEDEAKRALEHAEHAGEAVQAQLTSLILTRYHEEQLWSDKIRQASTWGTWLLMALNLVLFAAATFFVEPWKRRRLVAAVQGEVMARLDEFAGEFRAISDGMAAERVAGSPAAAETSSGEPGSVSAATPSTTVSLPPLLSWLALKLWAQQLWAAWKLVHSHTFAIGERDAAVAAAILMAVGWELGSLAHFLFRGG